MSSTVGICTIGNSDIRRVGLRGRNSGVKSARIVCGVIDRTAYSSH